MIRAEGACLPGNVGRGQDRWSASENFAVVLDGASSFSPEVLPADVYVDHLLTNIDESLRQGATPLHRAVGSAIQRVSNQLKLKAGSAPSSTVVIVRDTPSGLDVYALGDSTAMVHTKDGNLHRVTDERISGHGSEARNLYRTRLSSGHGFDNEHRELVRNLQLQQLKRRNKPHGYWIAEADPSAANHGVGLNFPSGSVDWVVLATDGAQRPIDHLGVQWSHIAGMTSHHLMQQLRDLQRWEDLEDPQAVQLPRAKRHDDKTLVACTLV